MKIILKLLLIIGVIATLGSESAIRGEVFGPPTEPEAELGLVNFSVSCDPAVQDHFNRAVSLLHHMQYVEAEKAFTLIAVADPKCGMAHWGVAMTYMRPLWLDPATIEVHLEKGRQATRRAKEAGANSEREEAYILAVDAFFRGSVPLQRRPRAWEFEMKRIHLTYPDDSDATAFFALAHLSSGLFSEQPSAHRKRAGELLELLFTKEPDHPGVIHYLIHAYDYPELAERGVEAARAYSKVAPDAAHALHMPSHIFVRLGMWQDCVLWNRRSADAALQMPRIDSLVTNHYPHAMDYLVYSYLQLSRDAEAKEAVAEFVSNGGYEWEQGSAYALAAIPARYALERHNWQEAADLPVRAPKTFPWDQYPETEAITWFARGLGAARIGDRDEARKAAEYLDRIRQSVAGREGECDWSLTIDGWRSTVVAWLAYSDGRIDEALELMRNATVLENSDKACATVGWIMPVPAAELLGDLFLEIGNAEEAFIAYERALKVTPRRFGSLYGAGRASYLRGDKETARDYYQQLIEMTRAKSGMRPRLNLALEFVSEN